MFGIFARRVQRAAARGAPAASRVGDVFQLQLAPGASTAKFDLTGRELSTEPVRMDGEWPNCYAMGLAAGESIETPAIDIGSEHVLDLLLVQKGGKADGSEVRIEFCCDDSGPWRRLADAHVGAACAGHQRLTCSLAALAGESHRFRLLRNNGGSGLCFVLLLRICAAHERGRVNALSAYEFRLHNEVHHFSGAAYTHSMYGPQETARGGEGVVVRADVQQATDHARQHLHSLTESAVQRLESLPPAPAEGAFGYGMRALSLLLPMAAPDFFARAARLSESKPLRILSILAGAARIEEQIVGYCSGSVSWTLLDASPDLIQRAADRLSAARPGLRVDCLVGDINEGLPGEGQFDVIVCVSALHHVADLETVLGQINRRLTDDGEFWSIGEQIGRNGNRLWPEAYEAANAVFAKLPERLRKNAHTGKIDAVVNDQDFSTGCFEGIRSEELESLLEAYLIPEHVYKRNAFFWRLIDATYADNFDLSRADDLRHLRELVVAEATHWATGGRSTELHGVYRKKILRLA
jgi:SAM-dependent methyltransferase